MHGTSQSTLYDIYKKPNARPPPKPLMKPNIVIEDTSQYKEITIRIPKQVVCIDEQLKKQRLFTEIEYLEQLYEHINIIIPKNRIITINVVGPKMITNEKRENIENISFPKMPIMTMCWGIPEEEKPEIKIEPLYLPKMMSFVIPPEYPMVPPFVYINNKLYLHVINCCNLGKIKRIVSRHTNKYKSYTNCISCATILKPNNWDMRTRFSDIFDEIRENRRIKKLVKYDILLGELMKHKQLETSIMIRIMEFLIELI
jgi:hypothetical protein